MSTSDSVDMFLSSESMSLFLPHDRARETLDQTPTRASKAYRLEVNAETETGHEVRKDLIETISGLPMSAANNKAEEGAKGKDREGVCDIFSEMSRCCVYGIS